MDRKTFDGAVANLMNRGTSCLDVINDVLAAWGFDLDSRKPGVAHMMEDGTPVTTLDMVSVLAKLVEWEPVIILSDYKGIGAQTKREDQIVVSKEKRHGKIVGLVSHQDMFNFSMRIFDMMVMGAKDVGDYRTFALFAHGDWNPGFHSIQFKPTQEEAEVLQRIASGSSTVAFETFIYPNRWPSIYGRYYLLAKFAIQRMADELKAVEAKIRMMEEQLKIEKPFYPPREKVGTTEPKTVWKFNMEIISSHDLSGNYDEGLRVYGMDMDSYAALKAYGKALRKKIEVLRFQTRATEYAFFTQIQNRVGEKNLLDWTKRESKDHGDKIPLAAWVKDFSWNVGWQVPPRKANKKYFATLDRDDLSYRMHINEMTVQIPVER